MNFCYWDAKSKTDTIVIITNQCMVTAILIITLCRIPNFLSLIRKDLNIDIKKIAIIHIIILVWAVCQTIVNYYSITTFLSIQHQLTSAQMIGYSHTYALISAFPGFLVQTLFITICFNFCRNLVRETDIRLFPLYSLKFVQALKIYYYFIRLPIRATIIILIACSSEEEVEIYSTAEFVSLIVDSAIINIFIFLSLKIFVNRLNPVHFRRLKREYIMMFCCSICRIVIDSLYLIYSPHYDQNGQGESYCVSEVNYRPIYTSLYNVIGVLFMHLLPIALILKIYRFDHRQVLEEELIPRSQHSGSEEH